LAFFLHSCLGIEIQRLPEALELFKHGYCPASTSRAIAQTAARFAWSLSCCLMVGIAIVRRAEKLTAVSASRGLHTAGLAAIRDRGCGDSWRGLDCLSIASGNAAQRQSPALSRLRC
jgi:hypothetical protein